MTKQKRLNRSRAIRKPRIPRMPPRYFFSLLLIGILGLTASSLIAPVQIADIFPPSDTPPAKYAEAPPIAADEQEEHLQRAPAFKGVWTISKPANHHEIEGYATLASATPGQTIGFAMSCKAPTYTTSIYRMGWYGGVGAELVRKFLSTPCVRQRVSPMDPRTGLINMQWPASLKLHITSSWQSGYYLARMTSSTGYQTFVPFLVRSSQPQHAILLIHATATDAAYNNWGGNSLYVGKTPDLNLKRGVKVSLNRPFAENDGAGEFLTWEYPMVRFLERSGYGVDYASDMDVNADPSLLLKYKAVVIAGHDEYWTRAMNNGYQNALKYGINLAIFAANTDYRPTRYEPDPITNQPGRIVVCYKNYLLDPDWYTDPQNVTAYNWRDPPIKWVESRLLGEVYKGETEDSQPLTVGDANSWVFQGTGLREGSSMPGLVGYEYDEYIPIAPQPKNVDDVFKSNVLDMTGSYHPADAVYYQLPDGGQVFNAGTIQWSWGLDPALKTYSHGIVKVTQNIINRFSSNPSNN